MLYSPVIYQPQKHKREIVFQTISEINNPIGNENIRLVKQPNWDIVHKNDDCVKPIWKQILALFKPSVIVLAFCFIFNVVLLHGFVPSASMEPTIMTGECLFSNRLAYINSSPKRGDIIVFNGNEDEKTLLIKRVIAIAGDTVELYDGYVYINGCKLMEWTYAVGNSEYLRSDKTEFVVPEDCVFVMGDNREHSSDSRAWENSFISLENIQGKAIFKYSFKDSIIPDITFLPSENIIFTSEYFPFNSQSYENTLDTD